MAEAKSEKKQKSSKKSPSPKANRENFLSRYFRETRGELRKVTWPTREESQRLTAIVLGVTALMALFLGLLDFVFSNSIQALVELMAGI